MKLTELNQTQLQNAKLIDAALVEIKLTNPFLRAGILAVVSKESGFIPHREASYRNTPASRIRQIFGLKMSDISDAAIDRIKLDDKFFFNLVYGGRIGNIPNTDDGYNFRGSGFNQLTGKSNYEQVGKAIGIDLLSGPHLLDTPAIASKALAWFFRNSILQGQGMGLFKSRYGITTTSEIADIITGARLSHQCNMGWAKPPESDPTGGLAITLADAPSYLQMTQK